MTVKRQVYHSVLAMLEASRPTGSATHNDYSGDWCESVDYDEARELAAVGDSTDIDKTLSIVTSAVDTVEKTIQVVGFHTEYAVEGAVPDVARFLAGEPENMMAFPLVPVPRVGRVITVVASVCVSASVSSSQMRKRGLGIAALVLALSRLGLQTEVWADASTVRHVGSRDGKSGFDWTTRTLVKGANDTLDTARLVFMFAHPAAFRRLMFGLPGFTGRVPADPEQDIDGAIYVPSVCSAHGLPEPEAFVTESLRAIGLVD